MLRSKSSHQVKLPPQDQRNQAHLATLPDDFHTFLPRSTRHQIPMHFKTWTGQGHTPSSTWGELPSRRSQRPHSPLPYIYQKWISAIPRMPVPSSSLDPGSRTRKRRHLLLHGLEKELACSLRFTHFESLRRCRCDTHSKPYLSRWEVRHCSTRRNVKGGRGTACMEPVNVIA